MFTARKRGPSPIVAAGLAVAVASAGLIVVARADGAGPFGALSTPSGTQAIESLATTPATPSATATPSEAGTATVTPTPSASPDVRLRPAFDLAVELPLGADDQLIADVVAQVVASPELARRVDLLGISVRDDEGRDVYDLRAHQPLLPASTQKLVTAAAALTMLGGDHRYETTATAAVDETGTVAGDLYLVGGGDPTLTTEEYRRFVFPARPSTSIEDLADRIVAAGVRRIDGAVVGDGTRFSGPTTPTGWKPEYITDQDGSQITALTIDAGIGLVVEPREGQGPQLTVTTGIDPVLSAATHLTRLLRDRGVLVARAPRTLAAPAPTRPAVAAVSSPPLVDVLTFAVGRSDNHLADTVLRTLSMTPARGTTWTEAAQAATTTLEHLGVDLTGARIVDGSGLSRDNRVTADQLAELEAVMRATSPQWADLQAVMGRSGTLRRRLRGTLAEGRVRGKTGTLDDVKAVVLTIESFAGEPRYHLAVVGNAREDRFIVQVLMDELVLRIIEQLEGCTRVPNGEPPVATEPPIIVPYDLACPPGVSVKPPGPEPNVDPTGVNTPTPLSTPGPDSEE